MSDTLGNIAVPDITPSGTFPLVSDYPHGRAHAPKVIVHRFEAANAKLEQRFYAGDGLTTFTVVRSTLSESELADLVSFWETCQGGYGAFTYQAPNDDGLGTTAYICRFADEPLTFDRLVGAVASVGVTLIGIPTASPAYALSATQTRFPGAALQTALLSQVQRVIALVKIAPKASGYPAIYVSDRRCTVGGQLYQARLLDWDGIQQSEGGAADNATFTFGNADRVMTALANDVSLDRARIEFSLFHVGTGTKIDLWAGEIIDWAADASSEFKVTAADGLYELTLAYPVRKISRTCWKDFNDGKGCPYSTAGNGGGALTCNKSIDDCGGRGMLPYFGGIATNPQGVYLKQLGAPTIGNVFRRSVSYITSVSAVSDTIYDKVLRDIYTDSPMEVPCDIAAGREESEFYDALGIVGRGPLGAYGVGHTLDDQPNHGPGNLGLRRSVGHDPAQNNDPDADSNKFSLGDGSPTVYATTQAAGVAFLEIRRSDPKGQQLSRITDHQMKAVVSLGLSGFIWSAPGSRTTGLLTNPVWIAVNMLINAKGMQFATATEQEALFDCPAAIAAAAICDLSATKLVGTGVETQFKFRGRIEEQKPLRDWMQEVLMNALGYMTNSFGKVRISLRINSSTVEAFTTANILFQSLQLAPLRPSFNHLTANFADEEFNYQANSIDVYDVDHAKLIGSGTPMYLKGTINLAGTPSKSQAARIISSRLREELGGVGEPEWKKARRIRFRTTVLALNTEVGQVCSLTHPDVPDGLGEFRVTGWRLNKDFSIDIEGRTTTDSMYDLTVGPKPADVAASTVTLEYFPAPERMVWHANVEQPAAGDPMYGVDEKTFALGQDYAMLTDGNHQASLIVTGELPVNQFPAGVRPPYVVSVSSSSVGGSLPAGNYYFAVCAKRSDGQFSPPSNILSVQFASGSTNQVTLANIRWPAGSYSGYVVFAATDEKLLCAQLEVTAALPTNVIFGNALKRSTWTMPNPNFDRIRVKAKRVIHAGVNGVEITGVAAGKIICAGITGFADNWADRDVSVVADQSDGSAALWNFHVTAYNSSTTEFTCTPDPQAAGIEPGDVLIIRTAPTSAGSNWVEDAKWQNGSYPAGMTVNGEVGNLVRIIAGTGRGQVRFIKSNTAKRIYVDSDWSVVPDSTTRFLVEAPGWEYQTDGSAIKTSIGGVLSQVRLACDNMLNQAVLVCAVGVDRFGNESPEDYFSPFREIWMYGQAPGVRTVSSDYTVQRGDRTIMVDATSGPIAVSLPPSAQLKGLDLLITRIDSVTANAVTIVAAVGETLQGGVGSITLDAQGDKFRLTAVG